MQVNFVAFVLPRAFSLLKGRCLPLVFLHSLDLSFTREMNILSRALRDRLGATVFVSPVICAMRSARFIKRMTIGLREVMVGLLGTTQLADVNRLDVEST